MNRATQPCAPLSCREASRAGRRRAWFATVLLLSTLSSALHAASPPGKLPRMTVIQGKDVNGTVYKKLGLPDRQYCWDACLKEDRCSGVRWGVIEGDTAGLCLLLTGPLSVKERVEPKTQDGKPIHVTSARKDVERSDGT